MSSLLIVASAFFRYRAEKQTNVDENHTPRDCSRRAQILSTSTNGRNRVVCVRESRNSRISPTAVYTSPPDRLHGLLPGPFLLSYSVFVFSFSLFFVSVPCARLSWPYRQLLSACKSIVSYRIVCCTTHRFVVI